MLLSAVAVGRVVYSSPKDYITVAISSRFTVSVKSTNPTVLHFIWITFTVVTADCLRNRCNCRPRAFGKRQTDENNRTGWDLWGGVLGILTSHSWDQSQQTVNNQRREERISSILSVGWKVFFLKRDVESRGHNLFTKARFKDEGLKVFWRGQWGEKVLRDNSVEVESECPSINSRRPHCCIQNSRYQTLDSRL